MKAVVLLSGGMDSTVLAYEVANLIRAEGGELHFLSFNYGQRHKKELSFAAGTAARLKAAAHTIVDLSAVHPLLTGSALTSPDMPVPDGHYTAESMKQTVVPNRNMIMLAIAAGYAVSRQLEIVATAVHAGDHAIYPDCRPQFIEAMHRAIIVGNEGFGAPTLVAPYVHAEKSAIAARGRDLNVPWLDTWSCYKGSTLHCGTCGTCVERREAFAVAGITDPTPYMAVVP